MGSVRFGVRPAFVPPDGRHPHAVQRRHDDVDVVIPRPQKAAVRVEPGAGGQPAKQRGLWGPYGVFMGSGELWGRYGGLMG